MPPSGCYFRQPHLGFDFTPVFGLAMITSQNTLAAPSIRLACLKFLWSKPDLDKADTPAHPRGYLTCTAVQVVLAFFGFNAALFAFSSLVPNVLIWGGAALLNISLLSSDLWAALARILFFGESGSLSIISSVSYNRKGRCIQSAVPMEIR